MARYTGPKVKISRRLGVNIYENEKGSKALNKRPYPPGEHGRSRRRQPSEYLLQLQEKQKAKYIYGVLERPFSNLYKEASRQKGVTGENLLRLLESRLDNVVYRLGFADSRAQARQLVLHGHFTLNGRKTDIPSCQVAPGDVIAVRSSSRSKIYFKDRAQIMESARVPAWLGLDLTNMSGTMQSNPTREDIEIPLNEQLIVEYYSR